MRVAIVGANLLGSSSAFYIRKSFDANRTDGPTSTDSEQENHDSDREDEIVVFERESRTGGNKYFTLDLDGLSVPAGTAAGMDIAASPPLVSLMNDAQIPLPPKQPLQEWTIFDWEEDEYKLGQLHSRFCAAVRKSVLLSVLLHLFAIVSAAFFAQLILEKGWLLAFIRVRRRGRKTFRFFRLLWFILTALLGGGVIPMPWLMRVYDWFFFRFAVSFTANVTYGGHSMSALETLVTQMKHHFQAVLERDAASSCVTLGHLLSACGMGKYAKASLPEFVGKYRIQQSVMDDCVGTGLAQTYADSACGANANTNALAALLSALVRSPMPVGLRSRGLHLDAEQTKTLCPKLLKAAGAQLRLGVDVRSVKQISKSQYELTGTDASSSKKLVSLGKFDAVVLASVVDPDVFTTDATDHPLDQVLALDAAISGKPAGDVRVLNTARYISVIQGALKAQFFKKSQESAVAANVTVLNSVNCSAVSRVREDMYRVSSWETAEDGSSLISTVFEEATDMVSHERKKRRYYPSPLRHLDGAGAPAFILGTRFLNAACVDRVANDANLDILSARNTGSFFRDGVATWK